MKKVRKALQRPLYGLAALGLLAGVALSAWLPGMASAAQVTSRLIQLSSSTPDATGVTYHVSFVPASGSDIGGIVVDFCADTPLVGTNCTYPTGFDLGSSPAVSSLTGFSTSTGSWVTTNSLQGSATNKQVLLYTNTTAQTPTGGATPITFDITAVHNPTATGSFYARILTFDTSANTVSEYTATGTTRASSFADMIDYGGVAMSTVDTITVTARVMESLSLCVYGDDNGGGAGTGSCGDVNSPPSIDLGTGTPAVIDSLAAYTNFVNFDLDTNASGGAVIRLKGDTLASGANTITAVNSGASYARIYNGVAGSEAFGLHVPTTTAATVGQVDAVGNYDYNIDTLGNNDDFALNTTNTTSTYGDIICDTNSGPIAGAKVPITYGVTASITTEAGVYTADHQLIASGTF